MCGQKKTASTRAAGVRERLVHLLVDRVQHRHVEQAAADARLVGRDDDAIAGVVEARDRLEAARARAPLVRRLDELVAVVVDDAVAVEDDELGRARRQRRRRRAGPWSQDYGLEPEPWRSLRPASRCRRRGSSSPRRRAAAPGGWRGSPGRRPSPSRRRSSGRPTGLAVASARSAPVKSPLPKSSSTCGARRSNVDVEVVLGALGEARAVDARAPLRCRSCAGC